MTGMDSGVTSELVPGRWPGLSIVVPVYRSELTLEPLVARLAVELPRLTDAFELILVDDSSPDGSWAVVQRLAARHSWVRGFTLMRNAGQHNALLCGLRRAQYDLIVTMDDDLQHPPEELHLLLEALDGFDVVYGTPQLQQHGLLRNIASSITKLVLQGAMGADTATKVSAWRVIRRSVTGAFRDYHDAFVSIDVLLTWGTTRFRAVPVRHEQRTIGQSNYSLGKLMRHALNMVTGFSTLPLQLASFTGFFFTLFGIGVLVYVMVRYIQYGSTVAGFPFLASVIAIFSGAQLFALGIMGEYLGRMHSRSMDRPSYVVRETAGRATDEVDRSPGE